MRFSTGCVQGKVLIKVQNLCFGSPVSHSQKHHRCIVGEVFNDVDQDVVSRADPSDSTIGLRLSYMEF